MCQTRNMTRTSKSSVPKHELATLTMSRIKTTTAPFTGRMAGE